MNRRQRQHTLAPLVLGALLAVGACETRTEPEANRPPVALVMANNNGPTAVVPDSMFVGDSTYSDIGDLFSDPDGDDLTFAVESLFPEVMEAAMLGDTLFLEALARGIAGVRVTASDPDGASASLAFLIEVHSVTWEPQPLVFEDAFTSASETWDVWDMSSAVDTAYMSGGFLYIKDDYGIGTASRDLDANGDPYIQWEIHTTVGRTRDGDGLPPGDGDVAGVQWGGERYGSEYDFTRFRFEVGPVRHFLDSVNYALLTEGPFPHDWMVVPAGSGWSGHVNTGENEDNEVVIRLRGGRLLVTVNDTDLVDMAWPDNAEPRLVEVGAYAQGYYYSNDGAGGRWDYYAVYGEASYSPNQQQAMGVEWVPDAMTRAHPRPFQFQGR